MAVAKLGKYEPSLEKENEGRFKEYWVYSIKNIWSEKLGSKKMKKTRGMHGALDMSKSFNEISYQLPQQ